MARWRRKRTGQSRETQGWEWSWTPMHEMHTWKTSNQELSRRLIFVWPALFGCILNVSGGNITNTQKTEPQRRTRTDRPGQNSKQELSRRLIFVWPAPVWLHSECKWWKHYKYTKDRATKTDSHRQTWTKQQARVVKKTYFCVACPCLVAF